MRNLIYTKNRIKYGKSYLVAVPDLGAGTKDRYTVYSIPSKPTLRKAAVVKIVGRELTLNSIKRLFGPVKYA